MANSDLSRHIGFSPLRTGRTYRTTGYVFNFQDLTNLKRFLEGEVATKGAYEAALGRLSVVRSFMRFASRLPPWQEQ